MMPAGAISRPVGGLRAFRISADDSNYFACLFDPVRDGVSFTMVIEIFEVGGRTPPNTHQRAEEAFFVLRGSGIATADGVTQQIGPGDCLVLRPGTEHVVENTGDAKLYCLTFMTPNEAFAELIHAGIPVALTADDIAVITGAAVQ